jgi:hypothetical protein
LGTAATRLMVIEAVIDLGTTRDAAEMVGIHERSIQRYAKANPWFDAILTSAMARADRAELLASLGQWADYEAGTLSNPPPLFVPTLPPGPPLPPREPKPIPPKPAPPPEPVPKPKDPGRLPTSYVHAPPPRLPPTNVDEQDYGDVLVVGVELVGRTAAEFLGVDQDLVDDANKDLVAVGLPRVEDISAMMVRIANDRTHPACVAMCRELVHIANSPMQKAQARRLLSELRREQNGPVIDTTASEVGAPGARPRGGGMVVLEVPPNKARPHVPKAPDADTADPEPAAGMTVVRQR